MPWWAALLVAVAATATGYAIDAGQKELTHVFAGFYIAGCVAAVLAVRQEGVFTAIIQPPLILFCAVPGAYWLFHGGRVGNLKDLLINCGYPLIERFPLMLGTAGGVLLIGLVRWYFGTSRRSTETASSNDDADAAATTAESNSVIGAIAAKLNSLLRPSSGEADADEAPSTDSKRVRAGRPRKATSKTSRAERSGRSASRPTRSRSRHARPALEDEHEPLAKRPRRPSRAGQSPPRDLDPADPPRRSRRRPRPQADPDLRAEPRENRRDPRRTRRNPYERPYEQSVPRSSRFEGYGMYEPPGAPEHFNRYEPYEPYEPYDPSRGRAAAGGSNGANPTHHPISRVRYREAAPLDEPRSEPRTESRSRSRASGRPPTESWEYDV